MEIAKSPVTICNFSTSKTNEIVIAKYSRVQATEKTSIAFKHNSKLAKKSPVTISDLHDLTPLQIVTVRAHVFSLGNIVTTAKRNGFIRRQDAVVVDSTGVIKIQLYEDDIGLIEERKSYELMNIRLRVFKNIRYDTSFF